MQELFRRFQALTKEYNFLKENCEGNAVTWKWTENPRHDPRPFWYERNRWKSGKYLKSPPARLNAYHEYGYDLTGNLMVERSYVNKDRFYETFHTRRPNIIERAHFHYNPDKEPIFFSRSTYQGEQIILWESCTKHGSMSESYVWKGNRVVFIDVKYARAKDTEFAVPLPWQKIEINYTKRGLLDKVIVHWLKHPDRPEEEKEIPYRRLEKTQNLKSLLELAKQKLFDAIVKAITRLELTEEVYCIAITWSPG